MTPQPRLEIVKDSSEADAREALREWVREYAEQHGLAWGACALLAQEVWIAARREQREAVLKVHSRVRYGMCWCCEQCSWIPDGRFVGWPCPTVAALSKSEAGS